MQRLAFISSSCLAWGSTMEMDMLIWNPVYLQCVCVSYPVLHSHLSAFNVCLLECDKACGKSCDGPDPGDCEECADGYKESEEGVCEGTVIYVCDDPYQTKNFSSSVYSCRY